MSHPFSMRHLAVLASLGALSGCGSYDAVVQKGKVDYKNTAQVKPLDIPPDLTSVMADERFTVPDVGSRGVATASSMTIGMPGAASAAAGSSTQVLVKPLDARIERNGNQRWLVINRPPEQVWPQVREFWLQSGFELKVDRPEIGILETDWAENRAKIPMDGIRRVIGKVFDGLYGSDELDRYRTRLERTDGGTEVYISHRGLREEYEDSSMVKTVWIARPSDPEMEAEFLNRLLAKLAGDSAKQAVEATRTNTASAATAPASDVRARLVRADNGDSRLQVRETFDRTWRRVGLALDRVGFTVEDRDRSKGLYFAQYREPLDKVAVKKDEKPGFFARIFTGASAQTARVEEARIEGRYRVRVAAADGRTEVTVLNNEGQAVPAAVADRILGMLESELR